MIRHLAAAALLATAGAFAAGSAGAAELPRDGAANGAAVHLVQDRGRDWDRDWRPGRGWERDEGDYRPNHWDRLSQREVRRILRNAGFHEIRFLDRGRRTYTVRAENRRGRDFIVTVHAYSGAILNLRPTYWR